MNKYTNLLIALWFLTTQPRLLCLSFHVPPWPGSIQLLQIFPPPAGRPIFLLSPWRVPLFSSRILRRTLGPFSVLISSVHDCLPSPSLLALLGELHLSPWLQGPRISWQYTNLPTSQISPEFHTDLPKTWFLSPSSSATKISLKNQYMQLIFLFFESSSHPSQNPGWSSLTPPFPWTLTFSWCQFNSIPFPEGITSSPSPLPLHIPTASSDFGQFYPLIALPLDFHSRKLFFPRLLKIKIESCFKWG